MFCLLSFPLLLLLCRCCGAEFFSVCWAAATPWPLWWCYGRSTRGKRNKANHVQRHLSPGTLRYLYVWIDTSSLGPDMGHHNFMNVELILAITRSASSLLFLFYFSSSSDSLTSPELTFSCSARYRFAFFAFYLLLSEVLATCCRYCLLVYFPWDICEPAQILSKLTLT